MAHARDFSWRFMEETSLIWQLKQDNCFEGTESSISEVMK